MRAGRGRPGDVGAASGPTPRAGRPRGAEGGSPSRRSALLAVATALALSTSGCDDIAKRVPWFAFMMDGPAVETYEQRPVPAPEGAVPVSGKAPAFPVQVADTTTALQNPLTGTAEELARGKRLYTSYCLPCHGPEGTGQGPVVNNSGQFARRLPFIPTLDLTSGTGPGRSDGYLWGMIENGRPPLMPEYSRIPPRDRWPIIEYVRYLQRQAGAEPERGVAGPATTVSGAEPPADGGGPTEWTPVSPAGGSR